MPKPVLLITLLGHLPLEGLRGNLCYWSHRFSIHSTLALCNLQEVDLRVSEPPPPLTQPTSSASLWPLLPSLSSCSCFSFSGITYLESTGFIFSQPVLSSRDSLCLEFSVHLFHLKNSHLFHSF